MTCTPFNAAAAFDDLEDETFWADAPSENIQPFGSNPNVTEMPAGPQFKERCAKCGGTGTWRGGRMSGQCFACKGVGYKVFRTAPADRYKARTQAADRKVANLQAWQEANAAVVAWVRRRSTGDRPFDFAVSLAASLRQYGTLTDGQVAAVERQIERDVVRNAERDAQRAVEAKTAPKLDVAPLVEAFATAKANSKKAKPILRVAGFRFKEAPAHGKNPGAIYVTEDETYLGMVKDGAFRKAFVCQPVQAEAIVAAAADPKGAAIAYGRQTGECAICGAELTAGVSIERGIGPICAEKWGW